jgi:peroxiredoxin
MLALRDKWLTLNQRLGMLLFVVPSDYNENRAHSVRHELPFLLLADTTGSISRSYGLGADSSAASPTGVLVGTDRKVRVVLSEQNDAEHVSALGRALP